MPARTYIVYDPTAAEIASTVLRLNRDRCRLVGSVQIPSGAVVLLATDDQPRCEVRPDGPDLSIRIEQPDGTGGASREIRGGA